MYVTSIRLITLRYTMIAVYYSSIYHVLKLCLSTREKQFLINTVEHAIPANQDL